MFVAVYIFWSILAVLLGQVIAVLSCSCLRSEAVDLEGVDAGVASHFSSACIYKELNMTSFSDFYRRAARQLTEFKNGRDEKSITPELLDYKSGKPGAAMFDIER